MSRTAVTLAVLLLSAAVPASAQRPAPRFLAPDTVIQGERDSELRWPVAVASASAIELAVADAGDPRLVIFAATGSAWKVERQVPLEAPPVDVVHAGGRYVVALRRAGLVTLEPPGCTPRAVELPAAAVPRALAATAGGGLLVYDAAGERVLALDAGGELRGETRVTGRLTALAAAAGGGFFAALVEQGEVRRYGPDGRLLSAWTVPGEGPVPVWPAGLVAEAGGGVLVVDRHAGRIVALDAAGQLVGVGSRRGWDAGRLRFPAGMARLGDGRLAVADQGNGRVQIFRRLAGLP